MLPFGVTIPATVPQRSEILEGLMNYPVFQMTENRWPKTKVNLEPSVCDKLNKLSGVRRCV